MSNCCLAYKLTNKKYFVKQHLKNSIVVPYSDKRVKANDSTIGVPQAIRNEQQLLRIKYIHSYMKIKASIYKIKLKI